MEISERVGTGNVTVFSVDPNFRAYSDGAAKLLYNAILTSRGTQTAKSLANPHLVRALPTAEAPRYAQSRPQPR